MKKILSRIMVYQYVALAFLAASALFATCVSGSVGLSLLLWCGVLLYACMFINDAKYEIHMEELNAEYKKAIDEIIDRCNKEIDAIRQQRQKRQSDSVKRDLGLTPQKARSYRLPD